MERHVFVVDPLPNVSEGVKKTLAGLNSPELTLVFEAPPQSLAELRIALTRLVQRGQCGALVVPLNGTSQTPVLNSFRLETGKPRADTFDLLQALRQEWRGKLPAHDLPILMPFLTIESPASVLKRLRAQPELSHVMGCLTSHILGITAAIGKNEVVEEHLLLEAFRRHFTSPTSDPVLLKDVVAQMRSETHP